MSEVGTEAPPTVDFSPSQAAGELQAPLPVQAQIIPRLFGGYRILRPLGKGGMGTVYEAQEEATGRRLALKVLSHSLDSEQARTRFFREGRLAASVNHPNSVYVFGTEEIDGMPVITMELASGGTLHDLVKRGGPLPVAKAVDAILQIIAGLEAAAAKGVLHRDIKPSNCFVDGDGGVKVGDFGLSISTLSRGEANLTTTAAMVGTPAYASPEQLRGDELDSRSDIYAVGVTLFYLLTARIPFTADNMVRLLATVLEHQAESPRKLRPEIPEELARVVLRCLAKQPSQRFRNYEELRLALMPFHAAATPASIGLRIVAGFIDGILAAAISITGLLVVVARMFGAAQSGRNYFGSGLGVLFFFVSMFLAPILTIVIPEAFWGATSGKALMGLRVVGLKRKLPGIPRALLRAVIVFSAFILGSLVPQACRAVGLIPHDASHPPMASPSEIVLLVTMPYLSVLLLFITVRRKNGQAAVQDLLSGTRVIIKPNWQMRPDAAPAPEPSAPTEGTPRIGPFHVLSNLGRSGASELFIGYDARLFRRVWIRQLAQGAAEVTPAVRMLTRHGRLRWLGGKRSAAENWDAYEALSGQPLLSLLPQRQPWKRVRFWLIDLGTELEAALKDQSLQSPLGLDRVWVTDDGRAKLLDFPAPNGSVSPAVDAGAEIAAAGARASTELDDGDAQLFLKRVAVAALEGRRTIGADLADYAPKIPMPLRARSLLARIGGFPAFDKLMVEIRGIGDMPAEISAGRRLALLAGCCLPFLLSSIVGVIMLWSAMRIPGNQFGTFQQMNVCLEELQSMKLAHRDDGMDQSLEIYIAGHFRNLVNNPQDWNNDLYKNILTPDERHLAESIVAARAPASEKELHDASERIKALKLGLQGADAPTLPMMIIMMLTGTWAYMAGLPAMIAAVLFRGGLLLHGLKLTVVMQDGAPARRWRVLWRSIITWMPMILATTLLPPAHLPAWLICSLIIVTGTAYLGAALCSLRSPQRGLQDWVARTYMVPN
jgi:hypothetical protein